MAAVEPNRTVPTRKSLILFGVASFVGTIVSFFTMILMFAGPPGIIAFVFAALGTLALHICTLVWLIRTRGAHRGARITVWILLAVSFWYFIGVVVGALAVSGLVR